LEIRYGLGVFTFYYWSVKRYLKDKTIFFTMKNSKPTEPLLSEKEIERIKRLQSDWGVTTDEVEINRALYEAKE